MKIILLTSLLSLFATNAFANSYCYDYGVFAVSKYEESIIACKADFPVKSFENLRRSLIKGNTKQALKASGVLRLELDNATWSSSYNQEEQKCIKTAIRETQKDVDAEVLRALELCL